MKQIATALVKAQMGFAPALKTATNPHFRSKYADLSACVEAVIDALNSNGIALIQRTAQCETGVVVETVFVHESGETLECGQLHVPASKADAQGYGSALTYARRYSLMAACGIAPEDDDGNAASVKPRKSVARETAGEMDPARLHAAKEAAQECLACLPDEQQFFTTYTGYKKTLDADQQVAMWGMLYGDDSPFPSANSVKTALKRGEEAAQAAATAKRVTEAAGAL